jgi:RHS repeat-associated protein
MKKTELKPKLVSLALVALLLCSIFTGAVGTDVRSGAVLSEQSSNRGNAGYESGYYYVADMVSSANGNLYLSEKDISIQARGFDIEVIRSYNRHSSEINGPFGFGWTYNYNLKLVENPDSSVTMFDEDGSVHNFISIGGGKYDSPPGLHSKLTKNHDASFVLRFKDGSKYNFDSHGTLLSIVDKNDNHLTFSYTDRKLIGIADDSGLALTLNYNADDRISSIVDPLGRHITYEYNDSDLVKVTDARGNSTLYLYYDDHKLEGVVDRVDSMLLFLYYEESGADRVKTIKKTLYDRSEEVYLDPFTLYSFTYNDRTTYATDALGHTTEIEVNDLGNPVKITDALGGVTAMNWDSDMNLVSVTDANGHTSSYEYDSYGNLISQTDPTGSSTHYGWNVIYSSIDYIALLASTTNALGFTTNYGYDARGNLKRTTDATGNSSSFDYDVFGDIISARDFRGYTTLYDYDTHGNLRNSIDAAGHTTEYAYDTVGRLLMVTDANGHTIANEYDDNDRLIKVIDALGNETIYEYNAVGSLISTTDANGHKTSTNSNIIGRVEGITDPTGNKTSFMYDKNGNLIKYSTAKGSNTTTEYDGSGRIVAVIDALGNAENYSYDAVGNLITVTDRNGGVTTYTYDALDRLVAMADQLGHRTTYAYNPVSNILSVQDPNGQSTYYEYDALDRVTLITDVMANEDLFSYDANGNLLSYTDAKGHATKYEYDRLNRRIKAISPLGFQTLYDYDPVGNVISKEDANGNTTLYAYDALDRLKLTAYPNGSKVKRDYDAVGNLIQISNIGIGLNDVTKFSYDELDRLTEVTRDYGSFSKSINYTYDENGNLATMRDPDGGITAYQCDEIDRFVDITDPYGEVTTYQYDKGGRRIAMERPNGVTTSYSYDPASKLLSIVNKKSSGDVISSYTYTYDNIGNRLSMTEADGNVTSYGYDALNRLVNVTYPSGEFTQYEYDAVGNRLSETNSTSGVLYTYDADNRLLTANGISYAYDNNGNLVSKSDGTNYKYEYENRLTEVILPDASQVTYLYSASGDRLSRTNSSGTIYYLYDLEDILMELYAGGVQQARYTHGPGIDEPVSIHRNGNTSYYQFDGLDSVTSLTDASENVVAAYKYGAFGTITEETGNLINSYKFTSREYEEDSGLYYYRARYYDAYVGRFLSKDPSGKDFDDNLYTYVENNPIILTDPSGNIIFCLFAAIVIGGVAAEVAYLSSAEDPTLEGTLFHGWVGGTASAVSAGTTTYATSAGVGTAGLVAAGGVGSAGGQVFENVMYGEEDIGKGATESFVIGGATTYVGGQVSKQVNKKLFHLEKWKGNEVYRHVTRGNYVTRGPSHVYYNPEAIKSMSSATFKEKLIYGFVDAEIKHSIKSGLKEVATWEVGYTGYYPYGSGADPSSYTRSDWPYGDPYSSYGGTDTTSIEDWLHFSIAPIPEKVEYKRGETVRVTIFVGNNEEPETIWLGVSFKDPTGESAKYDPEITITPESATIDHDEIKTFTAEWTVPDDAPAGVYKIAVNCWKDDTFTDRYSDNFEWASIFTVTGSTLSVRAENDVPGPVEISVHADGVLVGTLSFDDNDNSWSVESISVPRDTSTIKLTFVNDWYLGPEATLDCDDRNAYIDWLVIDGVRIEAEDFDRTGRDGVIYHDGEWAYPYGVDKVCYEPLAGGTIITMCHSPDWVELSTSASKSASGTEAGKYQKEILINENSGKTLTDYQILVDLRGDNFPSNAKTDGADIRLYDAEGEELSYWIEEYDYAGKHAKIWVKVPGIPANGETRVMMYYGNEEAGSVSDGDKVFEFFDDFENGDLDNWKVVAANWEIVTELGNNVVKGSRGENTHHGLAWKHTISLIPGVEIRAKVKNTDPYGVKPGRVDPGLYWGDASLVGNGYKALPGYAANVDNKKHVLRVVKSDGREMYLISTPITTMDSTRYYTHIFRIYNDGSLVSKILDGDNEIYSISSNDLTYIDKAKHPGFFADFDGKAGYWDNFIVRKYPSPEPTITIGA